MSVTLAPAAGARELALGDFVTERGEVPPGARLANPYRADEIRAW